MLHAFREVGFAYLENHAVDPALQSRLERVTADFFSRPHADKMKIAMRQSGLAWRGFFPVGDELTSGRADQKEGLYFGVDHPATHQGVVGRLPTFGMNLWPDDEMRLVVTAYMGEMKRVALLLMSLLCEGLGLGRDFFTPAFGSEPTEFFRIFGYPRHAFDHAADEWGVREHTDMGFLTILKQDDSGGLQARVLTDEWVDIPPRPNAFVLNVGDMLEFWTGGVLRSTPHRVRNLADRERFSYPYFFDPSWHTHLRPIEPARLAHFPPGPRARKRWDALELHALSERSTYGEFVWNKIRDVFPQLAGPPA